MLKLSDLLEAARELETAAENEAAELRAKESQSKREHAAQKQSLAEGYWQARWVAEQRADSSKRLVAVLMELEVLQHAKE